MTVAFFVELPANYAHSAWALAEIERHFSRIRSLDTNLSCCQTEPIPLSAEELLSLAHCNCLQKTRPY